MKAIILAAGYATRLYPLTKYTPKALLKIKGIAIIDHIVNKIKKIDDINEIIVITNNKFYKDFLNWYKYNKEDIIPITILNDLTTSNDNRLGAISDLQFAIEQKNINEDILLLACDNYFSFELSDFYNYYKHKNENCIVGKEEKNVDYKHFGIAALDNNNLITNFIEKPDFPLSNIITYAIYIYKKETLPLVKEYLNEGNSKDGLGNFNSWLYNKRPIYCYKFKGNCYDIGSLETYNKLNN